MKIIVAITGSSGVLYGIRMLEILQKLGINTHLVLSDWGERNIRIETHMTIDYVKSLSSITYDNSNMGCSHFQRFISNRWYGDRSLQHENRLKHCKRV